MCLELQPELCQLTRFLRLWDEIQSTFCREVDTSHSFWALLYHRAWECNYHVGSFLDCEQAPLLQFMVLGLQVISVPDGGV
jgi:hypothetical protein